MKKNLLFLSLFIILLVFSEKGLSQVYKEKSKSEKLAAAKKVNSKGFASKNSDTTWKWLSAEWFTVGASSIMNSNWIESSENSSDFSFQAQWFLNYSNRNRKFRWDNQLETGIAYHQKGDAPGVTSNDKINFVTKANYRANKKSRFFYSVLFALNSTYLDNVDSKGNVLKGFMKPGSLEFGPGINYMNKSGSISIFGSPITKKTIYVSGMGTEFNALKKKEKIPYDETQYQELGFLVNSVVLFDITPSIAYTGNYDLFSDYKHHPENVFINLHNTFRFTIGKFLALSWGLNFIYDDHLYPGPQLKSELGLTFSPRISGKVPVRSKK
jgi:hypothetical protein